MLKQKIVERMVSFSGTQAKVARFILENSREAPFMTASQIAQAVGVSESSVIRLASSLGYSGYPELKDAMKSLLLDQMTTIERMAMHDHEPDDSAYHRMIAMDILDLREAQSRLDFRLIREWAREAVAAPSLYLAAQRSSAILAQYLRFYLSWFLPSVRLLDDTLIREQLSVASPRSMVIGISFPRYSRWTVEAMNMARSLGFRLTVITNRSDGPMSDVKPEYVLTVPSRHISFVDSFTAPMSLINCLIVAVADQLGDLTKERLRRLEAMWERDSVYVF